MRTFVSVDVEDYFSLVMRDQMGLTVDVSPAVEAQTDAVLDLLDDLRVTATCFVVGYVARACPRLVRKIAGRGHEVASHGFRHLAMHYLTPDAFARDLGESIRVLSDITGTAVRGFRAPAFSLRASQRWAFAIMAEAGIRYDSSVRVVWPAGRAAAEAIVAAAAAAGIVEIPGLAVGLGRWNVPLGGGGGLRFLPVTVSRWGLRVVAGKRLAPLYIHPYDVGRWPDYVWPPQPRAGRLRVAAFNLLQRLGRTRIAAGLEALVSASLVEQPAPAVQP